MTLSLTLNEPFKADLSRLAILLVSQRGTQPWFSHTLDCCSFICIYNVVYFLDIVAETI